MRRAALVAIILASCATSCAPCDDGFPKCPDRRLAAGDRIKLVHVDDPVLEGRTATVVRLDGWVLEGTFDIAPPAARYPDYEGRFWVVVDAAERVGCRAKRADP